MKMLIAGGLLVASLLAGADVKVDNDSVRVLKAVEEPHQKTALHQHEFNRVMIYLDASDLAITHEDGRVEKQHWKSGDVEWSPAGGKHTSENLGMRPVRIVEVELKQAAPKIPVRRVAALDPVAIDPKHNVLLLENEQVRVFRSWREPGAQETMHEHAGTGRVAVLLTDLDATVRSDYGTSNPVHAPAGDALWSGPITHATKNLGRAKFEMIVVEVK
jgi:hypothetical protein